MHHTRSSTAGSMWTMARLCAPLGALSLLCCVAALLTKHVDIGVISLIVALASSGVVLAQLEEQGRRHSADQGFAQRR